MWWEWDPRNKITNNQKNIFFFPVTMFYVHCSFCFDMNLFLWQYIRDQCLTSLFMCRLLLELTLVENLVGNSTHSLDPCCLEHLGCCFLLFFQRYRLFVSNLGASTSCCIAPRRLRSGRQREIAEDKLGKENKKEGKKELGLWELLILFKFSSSVVRSF